MDFSSFFKALLIISLTASLLAGILGLWVWFRIRNLRIPANAGFFEALRFTPLSVVLLLDLLDFGLDIFAAPVAWVLLGRLGLQPLRGVTALEAIIPGTQFIPTMTLGWFLARFLGPKVAVSRPDPVGMKGQATVIDGEATVLYEEERPYKSIPLSSSSTIR